MNRFLFYHIPSFEIIKNNYSSNNKKKKSEKFVAHTFLSRKL